MGICFLPDERSPQEKYFVESQKRLRAFFEAKARYFFLYGPRYVVNFFCAMPMKEFPVLRTKFEISCFSCCIALLFVTVVLNNFNIITHS